MGRFAMKTDKLIRVSIVVSIPACHAGDPGSIPGRGAFFLFQPTLQATVPPRKCEFNSL